MTGAAVVPSGRAEFYGRVEYRQGVAGGAGPRDIVVWLPPGYDDDRSRRYPVLYMHDGQNLFDPATSYIGEDWQVDDVAAAMIESGRIEPFIAVGVCSGDDRMELLPSDEYRMFLVDTVKPMIDAAYPTLPGREDTAVMGSSMGGLASFLALWRRPDLFSAAGCLSPYLPSIVVDEVAGARPLDARSRIYLDNGDDDLDASFQPEIDRLLTTLREAGFRDGHNLAWYRDVGGVHDETAWAARLWRPLEFIYGRSTSPST